MVQAKDDKGKKVFKLYNIFAERFERRIRKRLPADEENKEGAAAR